MFPPLASTRRTASALNSGVNLRRLLVLTARTPPGLHQPIIGCPSKRGNTKHVNGQFVGQPPQVEAWQLHPPGSPQREQRVRSADRSQRANNDEEQGHRRTYPLP